MEFRLEGLHVDPAAGLIDGPGGTEHVDPKVMEVFAALTVRAGKLVTREELLDLVWPGRVVTDDVLSRCVYHLRRHLVAASGDETLHDLIETMPRRGYRLNGEVVPEISEQETAPSSGRSRWRWVAIPVVLALAVPSAWWASRSLDGESARGPQAAAPPVIAVLPFVDLSADGDQAYFADGVSEEILNRLSAFGEFKVIARTSSFAFKGGNFDIEAVAKHLNATHVVEGTVRKTGKRVRISTQLIDAANSYHLWADTFERELGEIFAIQDEIALTVARNIAPKVAPPPAEERLPNLDAYREYLIGRELMARRPTEWGKRASERFSRAIELYPDYAEAYAARAFTRLLQLSRAQDPESDSALVQQDVDAALMLDPGQALAFVTQATLDRYLKRTDPADNEALVRHALALNPNLVDALNQLARILRSQNRRDEVLEVQRRALSIDPLAPAINVNQAIDDAIRGSFDQAEQRLLGLLELPQPSPMVPEVLTRLYRSVGRLEDAAVMGRRAALLSASQSGSLGRIETLLEVYADLGMWNSYEFWRQRNEQEKPGSFQARVFPYIHLRGRHTPAERLAGFRAGMAEAGVDPETLELPWVAHYLLLQALAGEHVEVAAKLERELERPMRVDHRALAWALQHTGRQDDAEALLRGGEEWFRTERAAGRLHLGGAVFDFDINAVMGSVTIFDYALNVLLLGDAERALDLMEEAERAGWRGYYNILHDPRWDSVRDHPRFQAVMTRVKSDLDRQRAVVERLEAEDDFIARLEAVMAARKAL